MQPTLFHPAARYTLYHFYYQHKQLFASNIQLLARPMRTKTIPDFIGLLNYSPNTRHCGNERFLSRWPVQTAFAPLLFILVSLWYLSNAHALSRWCAALNCLLWMCMKMLIWNSFAALTRVTVSPIFPLFCVALLPFSFFFCAASLYSWCRRNGARRLYFFFLASSMCSLLGLPSGFASILLFRCEFTNTIWFGSLWLQLVDWNNLSTVPSSSSSSSHGTRLAQKRDMNEWHLAFKQQQRYVCISHDDSSIILSKCCTRNKFVWSCDHVTAFT